jgi:Immunity protein 35
MLDLETAKKIALEHLNRPDAEWRQYLEDEMVIQEDYIVEKDYGWILPYMSKRYIETGDYSYFVLGNYPIVVMKADSSIKLLHRAGNMSFEESIEMFEKYQVNSDPIR